MEIIIIIMIFINHNGSLPEVDITDQRDIFLMTSLVEMCLLIVELAHSVGIVFHLTLI